ATGFWPSLLTSCGLPGLRHSLLGGTRMAGPANAHAKPARPFPCRPHAREANREHASERGRVGLSAELGGVLLRTDHAEMWPRKKTRRKSVRRLAAAISQEFRAFIPPRA